MTEAERAALVGVVRVIRSAGSEESAVDALRDAITDAMAVAIERYGTGAHFERVERKARFHVEQAVSAEALEASREA